MLKIIFQISEKWNGMDITEFSHKISEISKIPLAKLFDYCFYSDQQHEVSQSDNFSSSEIPIFSWYFKNYFFPV